jgi:hypothetical protein
MQREKKWANAHGVPNEKGDESRLKISQSD